MRYRYSYIDPFSPSCGFSLQDMSLNIGLAERTPNARPTSIRRSKAIHVVRRLGLSVSFTNSELARVVSDLHRVLFVRCNMILLKSPGSVALRKSICFWLGLGGNPRISSHKFPSTLGCRNHVGMLNKPHFPDLNNSKIQHHRCRSCTKICVHPKVNPKTGSVLSLFTST